VADPSAEKSCDSISHDVVNSTRSNAAHGEAEGDAPEQRKSSEGLTASSTASRWRFSQSTSPHPVRAVQVKSSTGNRPGG